MGDSKLPKKGSKRISSRGAVGVGKDGQFLQEEGGVFKIPGIYIYTYIYTLCSEVACCIGQLASCSERG